MSASASAASRSRAFFAPGRRFGRRPGRPRAGVGRRERRAGRREEKVVVVVVAASSAEDWEDGEARGRAGGEEDEASSSASGASGRGRGRTDGEDGEAREDDGGGRRWGGGGRDRGTTTTTTTTSFRRAWTTNATRSGAYGEAGARESRRSSSAAARDDSRSSSSSSSSSAASSAAFRGERGRRGGGRGRASSTRRDGAGGRGGRGGSTAGTGGRRQSQSGGGSGGGGGGGWHKDRTQKERFTALNEEIGSFEDVEEALDFVADNVQLFNIVNLSTAMHKIGKLNSMRGRNVKHVIVEDERFVALVKKIREYLIDTADDVYASLPKGIGRFGVRELTSIMWGMAHSGMTTSCGDQTLNAVMKRLCVVDDDNPRAQNTSNALWAYATMHNSAKVNHDFLSKMEERCNNVMDDFAPQGISNSLWAFATTGHALQPGTVTNFSTAISKNLRDFKSMEFSNIIWALGTTKMALDPPELLDDILDEVHSSIKALPNMWSSQSVSNILWAMASVHKDIRPRHDPLLRTLTVYVERKANSFIGQGLANTLWALATLDYTPSAKILEIITQRWLKYVEEMGMGECANLMWSYGSLKYNPGEEILRKVSDRIAKADPQELQLTMLCNIIWAFANFDYIPPNDVMSTMLEIARKHIKNEEQLQTQSLSNIMWSLANLSYIPTDDFLVDLHARSLKEIRAKAFSSQGLSNMLWAWATLGINPGTEILHEFSEECGHQINSFVSQAVSNSLWAFCVLEHWPEKWVVDAYRAKLLEIEKTLIHRIDYTQIFQANMTFDRFTSFEPLITTPTMLETAKQAWRALNCKVTISNMHREVSESLNEMGIPHELEYITDDGLFSLDIALKGRKLCIEVDGPSHFSRNIPTQRMGPDVLRRRFLEADGWAMVNVLWWEWSEQVKTNRRTAYLAKLLYEQGGVTLMDVAPADEDLSDSGLEGFLARASSPSSDAVVTRRDGRIIVDNAPLVSQSNDGTSNSGGGKSGQGGGKTTAKSTSRRSQSPKSIDPPTKPVSSSSASSPKRIGYGMMLDSSALSDTPTDAKPSALGAAARRARVRRPQSPSTTRPTARTSSSSSSSSEKSLAAKRRGPAPRRVARRRKPDQVVEETDDDDENDDDDE